MDWPLLGMLSDAERDRVLAGATRHRFARAAVIFHGGDHGSSMHLVESGRVAIRIVTPDGDAATLTVVGAGDAFGEMALLRRSATRSASAVALEPVTALSIERDAFHRLCAEHPRIERLLVSVLAARVDRLSAHLVEALYLGVDQRVCRRLLDLCRVYGPAGTSGVQIPLTQEDVAGLAGATRPTVNTVLRSLQEAGVIALSRGRIQVIDLPALTRAAD